MLGASPRREARIRAAHSGNVGWACGLFVQRALQRLQLFGCRGCRMLCAPDLEIVDCSCAEEHSN